MCLSVYHKTLRQALLKNIRERVVEMKQKLNLLLMLLGIMVGVATSAAAQEQERDWSLGSSEGSTVNIQGPGSYLQTSEHDHGHSGPDWLSPNFGTTNYYPYSSYYFTSPYAYSYPYTSYTYPYYYTYPYHYAYPHSYNSSQKFVLDTRGYNQFNPRMGKPLYRPNYYTPYYYSYYTYGGIFFS